METGRHSGFSSCSGNWSWIKNRHRRLNDNYDYTRNETYTIYVPVEVDGRQVAKATAKYTKEEIEGMFEIVGIKDTFYRFYSFMEILETMLSWNMYTLIM